MCKLPFILLPNTEGSKHWAETLRAVKDTVLLYGNMVSPYGNMILLYIMVLLYGNIVTLYGNMVLLYGNIPLSSLVQYPHQGACIWSTAYRIP